LFLQKFSYNNQNIYFEDNSSTGNTCRDIHGTHVASICAGKKCGGTTGIAPDAFLYDLCVQSNAIEGGLFFVQDALRWIAVYGKQLNIDIVNMSLGGRLPWGETENIINHIMSQKIIVIAATGNNQDIENNVDSQYIGYPAGYPNVIAIGSLGHDIDKTCNYDIKSTFSECGENIDFCCPGHKIIAAKANTINKTIVLSGTSMASPYACGVIALLLGFFKKNDIKDIDNRKLSYFLSKMAKNVNFLQDNNIVLQEVFNAKVGFGKIDIDSVLLDSKSTVEQCLTNIPTDWKIEHVRSSLD
jgi:subtilisin family serine protease